MGMYKYIKKAWEKPKAVTKQYLVELRREPTTLRLDKPSRLDKARELGYKAKQGFVVVRQRVLRGGHTRPRPNTMGGRRSKHYGTKLTLRKNYQQICEERVTKKFDNCEVLNSYYIAKDGKYYWYEVILADKNHNAIKKDKDVNWVCSKKHTKRALRGLTSAGRKSRGLRKKKGTGRKV